MFEVFGRTGSPILGAANFGILYLVLLTYFLHLMNDDAINSAPNPAGELTAPSRVQTPIKHTSLHNSLGVLKCSKTHLQQTRISKIFRGTNPRTPATGSAFQHNEQGRQLSNAGPESMER